MAPRVTHAGHEHQGRVLPSGGAARTVGGMNVTFTQRAAAGTIFAASSWDSQIGRTVPVHIGERAMPCILVAAAVAEGGRTVQLTIEIDDAMGQALTNNPGLFRLRPGKDTRFDLVPAVALVAGGVLGLGAMFALVGLLIADWPSFAVSKLLIEVQRVLRAGESRP